MGNGPIKWMKKDIVQENDRLRKVEKDYTAHNVEERRTGPAQLTRPTRNNRNRRNNRFKKGAPWESIPNFDTVPDAEVIYGPGVNRSVRVAANEDRQLVEVGHWVQRARFADGSIKYSTEAIVASTGGLRMVDDRLGPDEIISDSDDTPDMTPRGTEIVDAAAEELRNVGARYYQVKREDRSNELIQEMEISLEIEIVRR